VKSYLKEIKQDLAGNTPIAKIMRFVRMIAIAWLPLLCTSVVAIIAGYSFLFLLDRCAEALLYACMVVLVVAPLSIGSFLLFYASQGGKDGITGTGDDQTDLFVGSAFVVLGFIALCLSCCFKSKVGTAVACIEASCECMFDEPTLLLEPLIALGVKVVLLIVMVCGFAELISTGDIVKTGDYGIRRTFEWTEQEEHMLGYYLFAFVWLMEFTNAMSQYVLAWTSQVWYFTPYVRGEKLDLPACGVCRGYADAIALHTGTLAFGSLLITLCRGLRMVIGALAEAAQDTDNPCAACLGCLCFCAVGCFESCLEFLNKSAYMDVAITSSNFCAAGRNAIIVLAENAQTVTVLNGSQFIFQIAGVGVVTISGFFSAMFIVGGVGAYNDPKSQHYVADWKPVAVAAGIISAVIGANFMVVFDTVGDTILYCYAICERRRGHVDHRSFVDKEDGGLFAFAFGGEQEDDKWATEPVNYTPPALQELIDKHQPRGDEGYSD